MHAKYEVSISYASKVMAKVKVLLYITNTPVFYFFQFLSLKCFFFCFTAVYFEQKKYDECISLCEKAVDIGREHRADYTLIAK